MNIWSFVSFFLFRVFWAGCHRAPWEDTHRMTAEASKVQAQDDSRGKSTNTNGWGWSVKECNPESWAGLALGYNKEAIKKGTKKLCWIDIKHLIYGENAKEEKKRNKRKKNKTKPLQDLERRKSRARSGAPTLCHPLAWAVTASCLANACPQWVPLRGEGVLSYWNSAATPQVLTFCLRVK